MPLPQFLLLIAAVIAISGLTILLAFSLGLPPLTIGVVLLAGAAIVRVTSRL